VPAIIVVSVLHQGVSKVLRPFSHVRGMGRVCRLLNRSFLRAGSSPVQETLMRDGTRIVLDLRSQTEMFSFYSGRYDDAAISLIRKLLMRFDGDFLDVGGNIGMYAVRVVAGLAAERRCVCYEPMPDNAARIRENARLNGLQGRLEIHEIALSDKEGEAELVLREDFEMGSATGNASVAISEDADGSFRKIRVPMRRFDDIIAELSPSIFCVAKVDIEGHEDFFLRGAAAWLARDRPIILSEINNWFYKKRGTTSSAVFKPSLPKNYEIALLRVNGANCTLEPCPVDALAGLQQLETIVIYPAERAEGIRQVVR
jgi:FkbM family methyltransferase